MPADNDVVIEIQYCGICHTDIHQLNNEWGRKDLDLPDGAGTRDHWYSDRSWPESDSIQSGRQSWRWLFCRLLSEASLARV